MRALVYTAPGHVELQDVDEPVANEGEVVVQVKASGICGSELHGFRHAGFRVPPLVMGHEFAGVTADGRRVAVNPLVACGECDLCHLARPYLCRTRAVLGIHRPGAFAERVVVPEELLCDLPADLSFEAGAVVEPLANGVHAWGLVRADEPERVAVVGAGTIGLVCLLVAKRNGAHVTVVDLAPERLEWAERLGADRTAVSLDGEYDVVFDAVGAAPTRAASVAALRPGGTAVWLGLLAPEPGFDALDLVRMEKRVTGSFAYTRQEFAEAAELARTTDVSWAQSFPLEAAADVFMELADGRTDVVKALVRP
ncbi:MAG: hypothetical protein QOI20_2080 [Acidimicrobiaceae bacterium]|jgi:alcohol dehydrogenase|nr:hypothetical protein [Acidimicrobiaceae bacterium]